MRLGEINKLNDEHWDEKVEYIRRDAKNNSEAERLSTLFVIVELLKRFSEDSMNEARLRREEEQEATLKKKNKKEGVSIDFLNGVHVRKGKGFVRKREAKVPDSVLQFTSSLKERDECDKKSKRKKLGKSKSDSVKLGLEQALDKASLSQNMEKEEEMHVVPKRKKLLPQASKLNTEPEPDMPKESKTEIERMNGIGILFIMEKRLMDTDIRKQNNRLSIPRKQIRNEFLSDEEKTLLKGKAGLDVTLIQPSGKATGLVLKKWVMTNTFCYNLIGGWHKEVVENKANGLKKGSVIRLWSFRQGSKLCFSLVKV